MAELPTHYPKNETSPPPLFHPLPSSTPITPGHHILVLPQKCYYSDPIPHSPECRVSLMLSQWNTPTVLPGVVNSTFDVSTDFRCLCGLLHPWAQLVVLVCLRSRSSIIAPPSVVGRSVLSSEQLVIEMLRFHALVVLCCRLCRLCRVVKTMSLTCVKHRRRRAALEVGLPFEVHTEWYWVVVTV